ncbi:MULTISPECIES: VOC family protein [unclassified Pseudactinotalea]|uniref:VOC family protein n=1 Tax=unclassified Pseudactinotalea TaxID=2649176 RepID=UPI00128C1E08|nr:MULTISPECIES: VOC family protein [unclassified Pseudactinotalea]MPV49574.1 VOC family protein [Pseudactinotalea sp. HY160]QGH69875.1 VOC family protein [Pseudactinotalea sp. HY158]
MAQSLATYIALPGTTAEAMAHWHEVLGGELDILRYGDAPPMAGMGFEPDPNAVAHATLTLPAGVIAGGDSMDPGTDYPVGGTAYSLLFTTETPEEARGYIDAFVAGGGHVGMPFGQAPWGDYYGQVFDRYGVMWAFSCEATPAA